MRPASVQILTWPVNPEVFVARQVIRKKSHPGFDRDDGVQIDDAYCLTAALIEHVFREYQESVSSSLQSGVG